MKNSEKSGENDSAAHLPNHLKYGEMNGSMKSTGDPLERRHWGSTSGANGNGTNTNGTTTNGISGTTLANINGTNGTSGDKPPLESRNSGTSSRQLLQNITEQKASSRKNSTGMRVNISGLGGSLNTPGNEKYLIETLKKEINDRGSPTSLIESPILRDHKKHSTGSSVSSSETNVIGQHSLSTSNLTNLLKRPGHERSVSNTSVKSAMTPSRRPNNKPVPGMSNNSFMDGNDKKNPKTLVDQFYSINETNPIQQDELGQIRYEPVDMKIKSDPAVTNYLLNIDTVIKDLYEQETQNSLLPILQTFQSINDTFNTVDLSWDLKSSTDLKVLKGQLSNLQISIDQLNQLLQINSKKLNDKYKSEIHRNVEKLNDLLLTLDNLEYRLNNTKTVINNSKQTISNDILNIIELLEFVDNRFIDYNKETRKTRFKQLTIALSGMVVLVSIYISIYGVQQ